MMEALAVRLFGGSVVRMRDSESFQRISRWQAIGPLETAILGQFFS